jgi:hypothetical protein
MSMTKAAVRLRAPVSPISVVFASSTVYDGNDAIWSMTAPDPGAIQASDVVLVYHYAGNGRYNSSPSGWETLLFQEIEVSANVFYQAAVLASRGNTSLSAAMRTWEWFVNFVGSSGAIVIVVLRGVQDTGSLSTDLPTSERSLGLSSGNAPLRSVARGGSRRFAVAFSAGSAAPSGVGAAAAPWVDVHTVGPAGSASRYAESQWFPASGTTDQVARSPQPTLRYTTALIHARAP